MKKPTHQDVVQLFGDLTDHKVIEILETRASMEQLEETAAWLAGESDVMGEARHPLTGAAERVYDILTRDEQFEPER